MIHISNGSGKMKGIKSINTNPLTNAFCNKMSKTDAVCSKCYSRSLMKGAYAHTCTGPYEANSKLFSSKLLSANEIPKFSKKVKEIRFHSHGELINETHLDNFEIIAIGNFNVTFTLFTKRIDICKKLKIVPGNMIYIYSTPKLDVKKPILPKGFDRVFSVYTAQYAYDNKIKINCFAKCKPCLSCYKIGSKKKFINEVVKNEQTKYKKLKGGE